MKINRILQIVVVIVALAGFTACDDMIPDTDIFVENKSDEVIYATYIDIYEGHYEDICLERAMSSAFDEIMPGETCRVSILFKYEKNNVRSCTFSKRALYGSILTKRLLRIKLWTFGCHVNMIF